MLVKVIKVPNEYQTDNKILATDKAWSTELNLPFFLSKVKIIVLKTAMSRM